MKKLLFPLSAVILAGSCVLFLFSCATHPETRTVETRPVEVPSETKPAGTIPEETKPVEISAKKPEVPSSIMGKGMVFPEKMAAFLLQYNPQITGTYALMLANLYVTESEYEGVNHDIAFSQMCLETGYLRYGGDVKPEQFNYAGLGAIGNGEPGLSFPDPSIGVRAQIQHLKAYGSEEPLKGDLVNPRFRFVRRGISPTIEGLAGTWAADRQYAVKINSILERLYEFSF